jgi:hypothetical protein
MAAYRTHTDRIFDDRPRIRSLVLQTRELVADSRRLLAKPVATTFLGLKSHEPFPREQDAGRSPPLRKPPR